jgi:hypothetical protein
MDFKVSDKNRTGLSAMLQEFDRIVLNAGGRFYFAKNSETNAETGPGRVASSMITTTIRGN